VRGTEGEAGCLGVVHVPKTGGSALRSAVGELPGTYRGPLYFDEAQFGTAAWVAGMPGPRRQRIASPAELVGIVGSHDLVMGHFTVTSLLAAGCNSIAMQVREPRARILSLYRYWQSQPELERSSWGPWGTEVMATADLALGPFLISPGVWPAVDNGISLQALAPRKRRLPGVAKRSAVSRVCAELKDRRAIVEWSSRSETFLERVFDRVGASTVPPLGRENVTMVDGDDQKIDASAQRILRRVTRIDRHFLNQLSDAGILDRRSPEELDLEFETSAIALGFRLD